MFESNQSIIWLLSNILQCTDPRQRIHWHNEQIVHGICTKYHDNEISYDNGDRVIIMYAWN